MVIHSNRLESMQVYNIIKAPEIDWEARKVLCSYCIDEIATGEDGCCDLCRESLEELDND